MTEDRGMPSIADDMKRRRGGIHTTTKGRNVEGLVARHWTRRAGVVMSTKPNTEVLGIALPTEAAEIMA
jgi:hypothetical protein